MWKYVVKRVLMIIPIFFIASVIIFLLVRIAPGDVASSIVGGGKTTAETLEAIRVKYHLDEPIFIQYGIWLKGIFQGDWGISYQMNTAVLTLIKGRIGLTLQLPGIFYRYALYVGFFLSFPMVSRIWFGQRIYRKSILSVPAGACHRDRHDRHECQNPTIGDDQFSGKQLCSDGKSKRNFQGENDSLSCVKELHYSLFYDFRCTDCQYDRQYIHH